jgi:hypothetical protein
MKTRFVITLFLIAFLAQSSFSQETAPSGFLITLKNGSSVRGRTLTRDEATGNLRLTMSETSSGAPKSFALIAMDDAESIRASSTESDSIKIKLQGGSELKCKEFGLSGDLVSIKLGSASKIEVRWDQIESISFAP